MSAITPSHTLTKHRRLLWRTMWVVTAVWAISYLGGGRHIWTYVLAQDSPAENSLPAAAAEPVKSPQTEKDTQTSADPLAAKEAQPEKETPAVNDSQPTKDTQTSTTSQEAAAGSPAETGAAGRPPEPDAVATGVVAPVPTIRPATKEDLDKALARKGTLIIKDATLADWMFTIAQTWKVDINFDPAKLTTENYSGHFTETPLAEVLNTILSPKNLTYQRVGNGLLIVGFEAFQGKKLPNQVTEYLSLKHADPTEVEPTLKFLLSPRGSTQIIKTAKTLIVNDDKENIAQIKQHVENLDRLARESIEQRDEEQRRKVEADLQARAAAQAAAGAQAGVGPNGARIPVEPVEQTLTTVQSLRFVAAADIASAVQSMVAEGTVIAIPADNKLVISANQSSLQAAVQLIRQLDVPRKQVRISAILYDVNLNAMEQLGVNWRNAGKGRLDANGSPNTLFDLNSATTTTGGSSSSSSGSSSSGGSSSGSSSSSSSTGTTSVLPVPPLVASAAPAFIGSVLNIYHVSRHFDVSAFLVALDQTNGARLLASPTTLVYDRKQSQIKIISEIPVQQLTQTEAGGNIGTTTFREAGVNLTVTPDIADDGSVRLTLAPEFSALQGFQAGQPIIDRRTASTTVRIMSGDTLVLGGLRRRSEVETVSGIPGLMNIKYLGNLFRSHETNIVESELIIFIQAEILEVDDGGMFREQVALQVANESLDHLPHATHAPFIPPCNDPYCPYHNPRPRVWQGNVLIPHGEWADGAMQGHPHDGYPYQLPPPVGQVVPNGVRQMSPPVNGQMSPPVNGPAPVVAPMPPQPGIVDAPGAPILRPPGSTTGGSSSPRSPSSAQPKPSTPTPVPRTPAGASSRSQAANIEKTHDIENTPKSPGTYPAATLAARPQTAAPANQAMVAPSPPAIPTLAAPVPVAPPATSNSNSNSKKATAPAASTKVPAPAGTRATASPPDVHVDASLETKRDDRFAIRRLPPVPLESVPQLAPQRSQPTLARPSTAPTMSPATSGRPQLADVRLPLTDARPKAASYVDQVWNPSPAKSAAATKSTRKDDTKASAAQSTKSTAVPPARPTTQKKPTWLSTEWMR